jgi:hypothetical protein
MLRFICCCFYWSVMGGTLGFRGTPAMFIVEMECRTWPSEQRT